MDEWRTQSFRWIMKIDECVTNSEIYAIITYTRHIVQTNIILFLNSRVSCDYNKDEMQDGSIDPSGGWNPSFLTQKRDLEIFGSEGLKWYLKTWILIADPLINEFFKKSFLSPIDKKDFLINKKGFFVIQIDLKN